MLISSYGGDSESEDDESEVQQKRIADPMPKNIHVSLLSCILIIFIKYVNDLMPVHVTKMI